MDRYRSRVADRMGVNPAHERNNTTDHVFSSRNDDGEGDRVFDQKIKDVLQNHIETSIDAKLANIDRVVNLNMEQVKNLYFKQIRNLDSSVETLKTEYKDLDKRLGYFESLIDSDEENKGGGKRKRRSRKRRFYKYKYILNIYNIYVRNDTTKPTQQDPAPRA